MATTKVTTDVTDLSGDTGGLVWAKGTTLQRPSGLVESDKGLIRENTDTKRTEVWNGSEWRVLLEDAITDAQIDYLIVAGGGGSGRNDEWYGGGGGSGGFRSTTDGVGGGNASENKFDVSIGTSYTVEVGGGGAGGATGNDKGADGSDSKFGIVGSEITSIGGGGGGAYSGGTPGLGDGKDGGCGGGAGGNDLASSGGSAVTAPVVHGYAGGSVGAAGSGGGDAGAGGGGAGAVGSTRPSRSVGGDGGAAKSATITGTTTYYSAGGGGKKGYFGTQGNGSRGANGTGAANSGDGGHLQVDSGNGSSGVVILKYPDSLVLQIDSGTLIYSTDGSTIPNYSVTTFTGGAGFISFVSNAPAPGSTLDFLVVGGAGSGGGDNTGSYFGGGGGGGGFRTSIGSDGNGGGQTADSSLSIVTLTNYALKVGNGGTYVQSNGASDSGDDSIFGSITSIGGGGGGGFTGAGQNGGSGGGGTCSSNSDPAPAAGQAVTSPVIHGYDGGQSTTGYAGGAGGGGAGSAGSANSGATGGAGGAAKASTITGSTLYYSAGGGGGRANYGGQGANGSNYASGNTGSANRASNGNPGVVILKYSSSYSMTIPGGVTSSTDSTSVPGYKITTFTDTGNATVQVQFTN